MVATVPGFSILAPLTVQQAEILSLPAQAFLCNLQRAFNGRRKELLAKRQMRQAYFDKGGLLDFLPETKHIREDPSWRGAPPAPGLVDRRVEITGPVDRKMVINALNSGASTYMADFEDSNAPTWENNIQGQVNLRDANDRTISFTDPVRGKSYNLRKDGKLATLIVRPRGWHLEEKHVLIDNEPVSGSIFDFALYFFHNARSSVAAGAGPYFYLPKMESHLEARLWNDIFNLAQDMLGVPRGTIRGTVLIETIPAAFEMEEIIYELREHSSGLNCGRWDYIFSVIKKFRHNPNFILPDRGDVGMTSPFMDAYVRLLIQTCHKRGVHAMGGMAAQIPIKDNLAANEAAMTKVRNDKLREVKAGHDGTWVAHPDLVKIAMEIFNEHMPYPNQHFVRREEVRVSAADLLNTRDVVGKITEGGIRGNIEVALRYMEAWLSGNGCVPIHNLMEDAATAEISRSQLWQWQKNHAKMADGRVVTSDYLAQVLEEESSKIRRQLGEANYKKSKFDQAKKYLAGTILTENYADFLTSLCYDDLVTARKQPRL